MLSLKQICFPKYARLVKYKYSTNVSEPNIKYIYKSSLIYRKARIMSLSLVIATLSFSTVGCATLQALEPTADLINDLKKIL